MRVAALGIIMGGMLQGEVMTYRLEPVEGAEFRLEVDKTGLLRGKKHVFRFGRYGGEIAYDRARPEATTVSFNVEARSATLHDDWVGAKDQEKVLAFARTEVLQVDKHPALRFRSTGVRAVANGEFEVSGLLEVRGVERPATITAKAEETEGGVWVQGKAAVRLKEFGIKPPGAMLGAIGTKDEMRVEFRVRGR